MPAFSLHPAQPVAAGGRYARQIRAEQVRSIFVHAPATAIGSLIAGAVLLASMWNYVSKLVLIGWMTLACLHQGLRLFHYHRYMKATPVDREHERWGHIYTVSTAVAGVIWGSAGVLMFVPGSVAQQAILALILFGLAIMAMISLTAYAPAFYVLIPLLLAPFLVRQVFDAGPDHLYLAALGSIVLVVSLEFGRNVNRIIAEAIQKRFENLDLIEELSRQKAVADQARQEAETANRSKTQFFAAASHDLRQPLHAMGLFAGALHEKIKDPEMLHVVNSINAAVDALEGLFNELLDISKIDSGIITPNLTDFALATVLDRLRADFEPESREKGLRLVVAGSKRFVYSDPILLERILRNLMSNALRYTSKGGVVVGCRWRRDRVRIEVWDSGLGIPQEQQEKVFEEFYQIGNPQRGSKKGLGLGLSIVRRLAALLGYQIELRSQPGRGTRFAFDVRLGTVPFEKPAAQQSAPAPVSDLSERLIVVIDDEAAIVDGMRVLLQGWGAKVIGSSIGDDVVAAVVQHGRMPDLIIADYRLGAGIVGTAVIDRLRQELDPEIPAILVTGSIAPDHILEAAAQRFDLLLKPVQPAKLRAMIDAKLRPSPG
jgi:signal transduction histidine kinase